MAGPTFRLYIASGSQNSAQAEAVVRNALAGRDWPLELIDVRADPQRALRDAVYVTPVLVKDADGRQAILVGTPAAADVARFIAGNTL